MLHNYVNISNIMFTTLYMRHLRSSKKKILNEKPIRRKKKTAPGYGMPKFQAKE